MSVTTRAVFDSWHRSEGDFVNFKSNIPLHRGATALIFRKAEYPNMNYSLTDGLRGSQNPNGLLAFDITMASPAYTKSFSLSPALYDVGVGFMSSNLSIYGILKELNTLIASQLVAVPNANDPTSIYFAMEGEFVVLKIEYTTAGLARDYRVTFSSASALSLQLGTQLGWLSFAVPLPATTSYTTSTSRQLVFCAPRSQTLTKHHIILCSKTLSKNSEQKSLVDPYFVMRLPIDPFGNPGDKQIFIPLNETRIWPIEGHIQTEIDFYIKPEHGGEAFENSNSSQRLIVYFDIFYGNLEEEITRVLH